MLPYPSILNGSQRNQVELGGPAHISAERKVTRPCSCFVSDSIQNFPIQQRTAKLAYQFPDKSLG
jgi:hypothetical protein